MSCFHDCLQDLPKEFLSAESARQVRVITVRCACLWDVCGTIWFFTIGPQAVKMIIGDLYQCSTMVL